MSANVSQFWRDPGVPFIEARQVSDGRLVCYERHSHDSFSIGAITAGRSGYLNREHRQHVEQGALVLMNPGDVHACNPLANQPWAYRMLYVDTPWLTRLQQASGLHAGEGFANFSSIASRDPQLFAGLNALYETLVHPHADSLMKHSAAVEFFTCLQQQVGLADAKLDGNPLKLDRAAQYIRAHCTRALGLDDICAQAQLSPSYLIRAFKSHYGLTPHAYLTDCRIRFARQCLRQGDSIADAAVQAGFADQAHLQRAFKRSLAMTPGHYRG